MVSNGKCRCWMITPSPGHLSQAVPSPLFTNKMTWENWMINIASIYGLLICSGPVTIDFMGFTSLKHSEDTVISLPVENHTAKLGLASSLCDTIPCFPPPSRWAQSWLLRTQGAPCILYSLDTRPLPPDSSVGEWQTFLSVLGNWISMLEKVSGAGGDQSQVL